MRLSSLTPIASFQNAGLKERKAHRLWNDTWFRSAKALDSVLVSSRSHPLVPFYICLPRTHIYNSLAKAEFYLTLVTVFHQYQDIELFDTNFERDVKLTHDMFLPQPSKESRGMRVIFK
jgi:hypothetical protein